MRKNNPKGRPLWETILLIFTVLFLLAGAFVFIWYGVTLISVRQTSEIHSRNLEIRSGAQQCTLEIPTGKLSIRRPTTAAVGANYKFDAEVTLDKPLHFTNCTNGIPNWTINLEAQTALVGSDVKPHTVIRQPAFDREHFAFNWTFTPEEHVAPYQSHLWLRVIITEKDQTVENWNILIRDFSMENKILFGQPTVFWLIGGGFSLIIGTLLLIILIQKQRHGDGF